MIKASRILWAAAALQACGPIEDAPPVTHTGAPTFEAWKSTLAPHPKTGRYNVDGDIPLFGEEDLRAFYHRWVAPGGALTLNRTDCSDPNNALSCIDDVWDNTMKLELTYCVSPTFGSRYGQVVQAMNSAAGSWERSAFVELTHFAHEDSDCDDPNVRTALFQVLPVSGGGYLAQAFFPSSAPSERILYIDDTAFPPAAPGLTLTGVLRHELGHILGFRHEHIRIPQTQPVCLETDAHLRRDLTPYDRASVMHYPDCGGYVGQDLALSVFDRNAVAAVYGPVNRVLDPGFEQQWRRSPPVWPWFSDDPAVGIDINLGYQANGLNNAYAAVWYGGWHAIHQQIDVAPNKLYLAQANLRTSSNVSGGYFTVTDENWNILAEVNFGPSTNYSEFSFFVDSGARRKLNVRIGYWAPLAWSWIQIDDVSVKAWSPIFP